MTPHESATAAARDPEYVVRTGAMRTLAVMTARRQLRYGDRVVVRTDRGTEFGVVLCEATSAAVQQLEEPLGGQIVRQMSPDDEAQWTAQQAKSDGVLQDVLIDGAIGTAVGTGIGALGSVALAVANVSLFIASPLLAPLVMLGWGASLGGLVGAAAGATAGPENKEGWLSDLVGDAIASGQVVLVAETRTEQETAIAREVIQAAVGDSSDINAV
jgi:hypothetical protein